MGALPGTLRLWPFDELGGVHEPHSATRHRIKASFSLWFLRYALGPLLLNLVPTPMNQMLELLPLLLASLRPPELSKEQRLGVERLHLKIMHTYIIHTYIHTYSLTYFLSFKSF